jgi:hypothetical protein
MIVYAYMAMHVLGRKDIYMDMGAVVQRQKRGACGRVCSSNL